MVCERKQERVSKRVGVGETIRNEKNESEIGEEDLISRGAEMIDIQTDSMNRNGRMRDFNRQSVLMNVGPNIPAARLKICT